MMARRRGGRPFSPTAGAAAQPQDVDEAGYPLTSTGAPQIPQYNNPAPALGSAYSQQAAAAFQALQMIQQNRSFLEQMDECPEALLEALDDLEVGLNEVIARTGKVIGELNEWAQGE